MRTTRRTATAALALTAAALLVSCSSTTTSTPAAGSDAVTSSPASAPTTTAAAPATGAQAVKDWYASGGQTTINTISDTMNKASADSSNVTAIAADCQQLVSDITAAQTADPIPDKQAQASWSSALGHLHDGASDCAAGAQSQDVAQVNKGNQEISEGTTDLVAVAKRIQALTGQ